MRYADPNLCPDCRSDLPHGAAACPTCALPVRHPLAVELFRTLRRADELVVALRATTPAPIPASPVAAAPRAGATATAVAPPPPPPLPSYPRPAQPGGVPPRSGIGLGAVPKILLGLGALCLLVAAIIFLAVSWSDLGVGARTAVLAGFTLGTGALALLLHRLDLRIAGESLIVVALGLLGLDVIGAGSAGWLGEADGDSVAVVWGAVWVLAGTALGLLRVGGRPRLVAPQVVAGIGLLVAYCGGLAVSEHDLLVGHAALVAGAAATLLARRAALPALQWSFLVPAGLAWIVTTLVGLALAITEPHVRNLWIDGSGWSLLASGAAAVVPGMVLGRRGLTVAGGSVAAMLATSALTIPSADTDATTVGVVALLVTAAWTLALALLPHAYRLVALAPASVGAVILGVLDLITLTTAAARWIELGGAYQHEPGVVLRGAAPETEPLLTVPSVLVVVALLALLVPAGSDGRRPWALSGAVAGVAGGLAAATTLATYDVPLAAVVAVLAVTALATLVVGLVAEDLLGSGFAVVALVVAGAATLTALPSAALAAVAAAVAVGVALTLHLLARDAVVRVIGGVGAAPALGVAVWSATAALDVDVVWRGIPLLAAVGLLAIVRARVEVEVPAVVVAVLGSPSAIAEAADAGGSLALHLTVAGCLVAATALIHESRREAAWAGSALLLLASWVRLSDLGVTAPEPYTLPLAGALTAIGLWHLRRRPEASTAVALTPGLLLATVPSLLWVLDDPASLRAVLLGLGAVGLTVAGALLRWSAPLAVGATVGAIVVVRELGPYAGDAPAWVWIGLGGALLVVVGITWERRLLELRRAVGLLGRLR